MLDAKDCSGWMMGTIDSEGSPCFAHRYMSAQPSSATWKAEGRTWHLSNIWLPAVYSVLNGGGGSLYQGISGLLCNIWLPAVLWRQKDNLRFVSL